MRRNGFEANAPDHADNDHDIDKQHRRGDVFARVQRLSEQIVEQRQPHAQPEGNHQFFQINAFNKQQQQQRKERHDGNGEALPQLRQLHVNQQVD